MDEKAPAEVRPAEKKTPYPEAVPLLVVLAVLVVGFTVFSIKRSFDEGVNRALGEAFAKSVQGASESLSRATAEDCERFLRVAGATLDLVAPPDEEKSEHPLRKVADFAIATAKRELREGGMLEERLLDDALGSLERRADEAPSDADRLTDRALLLILKLGYSRTEDEEAELAAEAERALDEALEIDGSLWRPRFYRASLSYLRGRREAAIRRFEALIREQETLPEREEHALPHVFLGNLHLQQGSRERAREVWEEGLAAFPGNEDLAARLERLSKAR